MNSSNPLLKKNKLTGLFFGSFNPVHSGHLILANYFTEHGGLDEVWFVVTPQNPLKKRSNLLADHHRLYMVRLATEPYPKFKVSTVEFDLPKPNFTIVTLEKLKEDYPQRNFVLLMGQDALTSLPKWKNFEQILKNYSIYVYPRRLGGQSELFDHPSVKFFNNAPVVEISASQIRRDIQAGKNVRPLLPPEVYQYLTDMGFYRKTGSNPGNSAS